MAQSKQAKKRVRQNAVQRLRNRGMKSSMKTAIRRVEEACDESNKEAAAERLAFAMKRIDKCAKRNIVHRNNASRKKSSLAKRVALIGA